MGTNEAELCRCGHPRRAHEHYRAGTECSLCDGATCPRFRSGAPWWRRVFSGR